MGIEGKRREKREEKRREEKRREGKGREVTHCGTLHNLVNGRKTLTLEILDPITWKTAYPNMEFPTFCRWVFLLDVTR